MVWLLALFVVIPESLKTVCVLVRYVVMLGYPVQCTIKWVCETVKEKEEKEEKEERKKERGKERKKREKKWEWGVFCGGKKRNKERVMIVQRFSCIMCVCECVCVSE